MASQFKLYLFGDQTFDIQPSLKSLFQNRSNPVLDLFFREALIAIQAEVQSLRQGTLDEIPRFHTLEDLVSWNQTAGRLIGLDMAITCLYQIGTFIAGQGDVWSRDNEAPRVAGICTGALAAAAVSCSRGLLDLIPAAVDAVTVAFRVGTLVADVAHRVSPRQDFGQSWSMIASGLASSEAVDKFCQQSMLPLTSRPYVSAYALNGITVSGPPRLLAQLSSSDEFKDVRSRSVPVYGPYHASHLYSQQDIANVIGNLATGATATRSEFIPFLSGEDGEAQGHSFVQLLEAALRHILLQPIRWSNILDRLQSDVEKVAPESFSVTPIGTAADQLIYTALKQTSLRELVPSSRTQPQTTAAEGSSPSSQKTKIAIVGMSGRFPNARDNDAFWEVLTQGLDVHQRVPANRWDTRTHVDASGRQKNASAAQFGCFLDDPGLFDARFFNIAPRAAPQIDPQQRLALMTAYEAIEQAGIVPDATPSTKRDRVGVFYGVTGNDWMETNSAQNVDTYYIPGGNRAFIPGRINYYFKFGGPSYALDTACSSSLASIHLACNLLSQKEIDTAIAGGTNIITNPDLTAGYDRGHFLTHKGNCKPFDDGADGYCRGEGVGTVVVKRLDDAIADNDPILGVILGAETNHSVESDSITRPDPGAQISIFNKILSQAAVEPNSIDYIEMHGTGTQAGDAGEMSSVLDTFAPPLAGAKASRKSSEKLYLGSAKANIGHGEAASGVAGLMKVLLMMQNNSIVPHCGIKTKINSKFPTDMKERNVNIALESTPWERSLVSGSKPRRAFVNNFSAAGGNTAMLLEDGPIIKREPAAAAAADPRTHHLVACSAKTSTSLQGNLRSMLGFLKQNPDVSLGQLSYTTTARRIHYQHRVMLSGSVEQMSSQIEAALQKDALAAKPRTAPKLVFVFTGQGAQYPGMARQLFENVSVFSTEICRLDQLGQSLGFPSILPVIQSDEQDIRAFSSTAVQLASICIQISLTKMWASWNVTPSAVIGHSLGEYAALNVAGVISDADTLYLVGKRAELLQEKCTRNTHTMLVTKASVETITSLVGDKKHEVVCINSSTETVLAGSNEEVSDLKELLTDAGIKCTQLAVPYAFHSSQVDPILSDFKRVASGATFCKSKLPIICPLTGEIVDGTDSFSSEYLARHAREPVNMLKALQTLSKSGLFADSFATLEIGPQPAVSGMVKAVLGSQVQTMFSLQRNKSNWEVVGEALKSLYAAGADIRWAEFHRDFQSSHKVIRLPSYSWDAKEYWIQYVHDWSLRKGEPLPVTNASGLESTTIHKVVEESSDPKKVHMVVESDMARNDFARLVQGHKVDGVQFITPSIYADIASSLGKYVLRQYRPNQKENLVDVSEMSLSKPLILQDGATEQLLQVHVEVDWTSQSTAVKYMSFDNKKTLQEHARCVLRFHDASLPKGLKEDARSLFRKQQVLRDGVASGSAARFNRSMVYRYIQPLEWFHADYQGVDEVVLNSKTLEASTRLSLGNIKKDGNFNIHPAAVEALTQSCVFAMNCNDNADLDTQVFVNHGWRSFQIFKTLESNKAYTTYARMEEGADKLWHGDIFVLDGENIVALFRHTKIEKVSRRLLRSILSVDTDVKSETLQTSTTPAVAKPRAAQEVKQAPQTCQPSKPSQASSQECGQSKLLQALSIIAEISGVAVNDLSDDTSFSDLGIDSLLVLTISSRLKGELHTDLDYSSLLSDNQTVGDFKETLGTPLTTPELSEPSSPGSSSTEMNTPKSAETDRSELLTALSVIAEVSGVAVSDLSDGTSFSDLGIDSLLVLTISSRLKEELHLVLDYDKLLNDNPTVGALKETLGAFEHSGFATPTNDSTSVDASESSQTGATTPNTDVDLEDNAKCDFGRVLEVFSEESGVAVDDFGDDLNFADSGIDSLVFLVILGRLQNELKLDIKSQARFLQCLTVADLKQFLSGVSGV